MPANEETTRLEFLSYNELYIADFFHDLFTLHVYPAHN
jgi:hypothetical protein